MKKTKKKSKRLSSALAKNKKPLTRKTSAVRKIKTAAAKKNTSSTDRRKSYALAESEFIASGADPAHAPGHKKMNLRSQFDKTGHKSTPQNGRALNNMSAANKIKRTSATNRRIITGAAVGKTGQIVIK